MKWRGRLESGGALLWDCVHVFETWSLAECSYLSTESCIEGLVFIPMGFNSYAVR